MHILSYMEYITMAQEKHIHVTKPGSPVKDKNRELRKPRWGTRAGKMKALEKIDRSDMSAPGLAHINLHKWRCYGAEIEWRCAVGRTSIWKNLSRQVLHVSVCWVFFWDNRLHNMKQRPKSSVSIKQNLSCQTIIHLCCLTEAEQKWCKFTGSVQS